jgi:23S rRNA (adenine2503-C2)-methyltransferase
MNDPTSSPEPPGTEQLIPPRRPLLGLGRGELAEVLADHVDRPFRIDQIYRGLYERRIDDLDQLSELGKEMRQRLAATFEVGVPEVESRHRSADGTTKLLLRLNDGATIETVDIPDGERRTICVSSQAGCALACRFCVTGYWGAGRNLTPGEIIGQIHRVLQEERAETNGLNLVFMGMGEPLLNLDNVRGALEILMERISWRRITLSTAGVIPGIEDLATWPRRPKLAISLHAPDDARRSDLMPINKKYPLAELIAVLRRFPLTPQEHITFEYIVLGDWNDSAADAKLLARLLRGLHAKVNLIPLNADAVLDPALKVPSPARVEAFRRALQEQGVVVTVRKQRGDDVSAACGQLRVPTREPRGFRRSNLSF